MPEKMTAQPPCPVTYIDKPLAITRKRQAGKTTKPRVCARKLDAALP